MTSTVQLVKQLKQSNQDFEFYPTTTDMLDIITDNISKHYNQFEDSYRSNNFHDREYYSILDIGAGNCVALLHLADYITINNIIPNLELYAIEKSQLLIDNYITNPDNDIRFIGADLHSCSLVDKPMEIVFCNPPYSEYEQFMIKLLNESNCKLMYLIVPDRWKDNHEINVAIKSRKAIVTVIHSDNFLDGERKARANIDIIKVDYTSNFKDIKINSVKVNPFDLLFNNFVATHDTTNQYNEDIDNTKSSEDEFAKRLDNEIVKCQSIVGALVQLYTRDNDKLFNVYKQLVQIPKDVLKEFDVKLTNISDTLKKKLSSLKRQYWTELFKNYTPITKHLTSVTLSKILSTMDNNNQLDFNNENCYAITGMILKIANQYYDEQLINIFECMMNDASTTAYKSNKKYFDEYNTMWRKADSYGAVTLDYRIILTGYTSYYSQYECDNHTNLPERATNFIKDIMIIAENLGFNMITSWKSLSYNDNSIHNYYCTKYDNDEQFIFMAVRSYKNGNFHIKFNQDFMKLLNVQHGLLKGWLKSRDDIKNDMQFKDKSMKINDNEIDLLMNTTTFKLGKNDVDVMKLPNLK